MEVLQQIRKGIDKVLSALCIFIFGEMVVVGTYQIVTRFIFNKPSTVSEELLTYSFAWLSLLSAAYIFGKREHMRMGFLADKIKGGAKKGLEIVIEAVAVIFAVVVMVYGGFNIMGLTMAQTTASLPVTMGVVYTVLPLSGIVIAIYGVLNIIDLAHGKGLTLDEVN